MYCSHCGAPMETEQSFCSRCGTALPGVMPRPTGAKPDRLTGHLHLLAIFWFVVGILWLIPAGIMLALGSVAVVMVPSYEAGAQIARVLGPLVMYAFGAFLIVIAILCFAAGYGLLHVRHWARGLAIILGSISLLHPPFGTALGIYTLWVLLAHDAALEYDRLSATA